MHRSNIAVLVGVAVLMAAASASAAEARSPQPSEPLVVAESFLAARNARDPSGAAGMCADLLELQDVDRSWLVDGPTMSDWLRQLTDKYLLDTMSPLLATGDTVTWTERLTPRAANFPDAWSSAQTVEVHAVVRDGKIAYLSAPYPALAPGSPDAAGEPGTSGARSGMATVPPAGLFVGTALGLAIAALAVRGAPVVYHALQRRERLTSGSEHILTGGGRPRAGGAATRWG
jgi:hypothetical protein